MCPANTFGFLNGEKQCAETPALPTQPYDVTPEKFAKDGTIEDGTNEDATPEKFAKDGTNEDGTDEDDTTGTAQYI